jgi:protein involved in polysaccharide export with SLBB domain
MSTRCSIFGEVSLAAAFVILAVGFVPISGQTTAGQTRPRSLANRNDGSATITEETQPQVGSPEANAKAKKLYKAGVQYGNAGLFTQAAETFRLALILKPDYSDAYRSLGRAQIDLNQWEQAVQSLEHALTLDPKDKEARRLLDEARLKLTSTTNEGSKSEQPAGSRVAMNVTASTSSTSTTSISENEPALTKIYRVGPGDVLDVLVGATPSADSIGITITTSGLLVHTGLAEPLPVAGLTVEEITARLQSVLEQRPSTANAKVSVGIRDYVSHTILVSGLVKDPGTKILRREAIPLSVVVADAQPLPEAGRVTVVRNESNQSFIVDLEQTAEMSMLIHPGDVITLQATPTQFFYVAGDVKAPGEKIFRSGLTLTQAIITAGGATGKPTEARLSRDDGKGFLKVTRYKLKEIDSGKLLDPLIQPGDRITIIN